MKTNAEIKLHNLRGELRFLVTLDPEFKARADFLTKAIERCRPAKREQMHDEIKTIINEQHEKIKNGI